MGDNSVDMIPTALDNGELGQTRQWRINRSIAQRNHLGILAHKWCHHHAKLNGVRQYHVNLLWCFTFTVNMDAISERSIIQIYTCLIALTNQDKPKSKMVTP